MLKAPEISESLTTPTAHNMSDPKTPTSSTASPTQLLRTQMIRNPYRAMSSYQVEA